MASTAITANNGDETISIIDTQTNSVAATLEAGPDMTGVNFAAGKAFVISSTSGFVYVYDMSSLKPAGRIRIGTNIQLETATTDTQDQKIYLAESTNHEVVIIDAKTNAIERVRTSVCSLGHAHHGQQGQLLPLSRTDRLPDVPAGSRTPVSAEMRSQLVRPTVRFALLALLVTPRPPRASAIASALQPDKRDAVTEAQANELTLTLTEAAVRPIQIWVRTAGAIDAQRQASLQPLSPRRRQRSSKSDSGFARFRRSRARRCTRRASRSVDAAGRSTCGDRHARRARRTQGSARYVLEIVTEHGDLLSVPNEAIIETGGKRVVYVQDAGGRYAPREIQPGVQGELYTEVLERPEGGRPGRDVRQLLHRRRPQAEGLV